MDRSSSLPNLNAGDTLSFHAMEQKRTALLYVGYMRTSPLRDTTSDSVIDEEEGLLYLVSTGSPYIVIIDIQIRSKL